MSFESMDQVNTARFGLQQKVIPANQAYTNSSKLTFAVDPNIKDEDQKIELETHLATIEQTQVELLRFAKEINEEGELYKQLVESLLDDNQRAEAGERYVEFMSQANGPAACVASIDAEIKRLQNEQVRLKRYLDAVNSKISIQDSTAGGSGTGPSGGTPFLCAPLPSCPHLVTWSDVRHRV